jgi:Arc/MetJ-type ribon-helix-helix transcriptional regulator
MNILLTVDQTNFVQAQVASGQFLSPEEVIAIALEMMRSAIAPAISNPTVLTPKSVLHRGSESCRDGV